MCLSPAVLLPRGRQARTTQSELFVPLCRRGHTARLDTQEDLAAASTKDCFPHYWSIRRGRPVATIPRSTGREVEGFALLLSKFCFMDMTAGKQFLQVRKGNLLSPCEPQISLTYHCKAHCTAEALNGTPEGLKVEVCDNTDLIPRLWVRLANRYEIVHLQLNWPGKTVVGT